MVECCQYFIYDMSVQELRRVCFGPDNRQGMTRWENKNGYMEQIIVYGSIPRFKSSVFAPIIMYNSR